MSENQLAAALSAGIDALKPEEIRRRIQQFENVIARGEQLDIPIIQHFCAGVYLRRINIPAGAILTGNIHKYPCLSIVLSGEIEVVTEEGARRIKGPMIYESPAGIKRAMRALTDCSWVTVHANPNNLELDPEAMAEIYTVETYSELEAFQQLENKPCLS